MESVMVTVVGSRKRINLALPMERPIRDLLGALAERCGELDGLSPHAAPHFWTLTTSDSETLPSEKSLRDCGVWDGAVIYLHHDPGPAAGGAPRSRTPSAWPLPQHLPLRSRYASVIRAMLPGRDHPDDAAVGNRDSRARDLAVHQQISWLNRGRRAWRSSSYITRLDTAITGPRLQRCSTVAVMSPKGGVGKTMVSVLLGTLLSQLRRDRVVAVDTNPDYGSLGRSLVPGHALFADDLLARLQHSALTATALDALLGRGPHGLMVLPAPSDPARMARLDEDAYTQLIRSLQDLVGVVILDCGTGLQEPATRAALKCADHVMLITDADPATASIVVDAFRQLSSTGGPVTLVVNKMPARGSRLSLDALASKVETAVGVVVIPYDAGPASRIATGDFNWQAAPKRWQIALRELAAVLFESWRTQDLLLPAEPT
ncbi:MAG TPA: EsaB/YukD family protein [Candidatus Binatia bacterium]|nr:EsaB/YukD family protein [Candidatus Binatia bacterium]